MNKLPSIESPLEHIIQLSRFARQDGWQLYDISLCSSGNIAVSGHKDCYPYRSSFVCVYSTVDNSDSRDKPTLLYNKEFEDKYSGWPWRRISFLEPNSTEIVTCRDDEVQVIDYNRDVVLRSRKVNGETTCLSVSESQIFIGLRWSDIVNIYDKDLNRIKSIRLKEIRGDNFPWDMTAAADRLYVRTAEYPGRAIVYSQTSGSILTEYNTGNYAYSVTVNVQIAVVAVLWDGDWSKRQVAVYSFTNNNCLVVFDVESDVSRIRISDQGKIVTGYEDAGEVKIYDLVTYDFMKIAWAASLQKDDCMKLTDHFCLSKDQSNSILKSDTPAKALLLALEERDVIGVSNVSRLVQAFTAFHMNETFCHAATIYEGKAKANSYDRFLVGLSAHLTASVAGDLCDHFEISDEKKTSITSNQNPGLSLLLALHKMGVINQSRVGPLETPFTKFRLVQAVAKIREYQSLVEVETDLHQQTVGLTIEGKRNLFVKFLQKKLKCWYDTMTPVPWKKSCRWKSSDLFVGSGLILTKSKTQKSVSDIDEQCKIHYSDILSHVNLKDENRIIIEGEPGSGKTMLSSQLAYDWSQGKVKGVNIFILLPLKLVEKKTLVEAIKDFYLPEGKVLSLADIEDIITSEDRNCCFLLDGLEEYNDKDEKSTEELSEVGKVMAKDKYPKCKVIITSRSGFSQDLPPCPMLKLGQFSKIQRHCYIEKVFSDDFEKQMEVKKFIDDTQFILDICSVPLLFVLVVHNYEGIVSVQNVPQDRIAPFVGRMVEILCPSTQIEDDGDTCREHSLETSPQVSQASFESFQQKSQTISLDTLAFNGICKGWQQLFWQKRFMEENVRNVKQYLDSGILVIEETVNVRKAVDRFPQGIPYTDEFAVTALSEIPATNYIQGNNPAVESDQATLVKQDGGRRIEEGGSTNQSSESNQIEASESQENINRNDTPEGGRGVKKGGITNVNNESNQSEAVSEESKPINYISLQVKFLHKVIQEWFAAKHLADIFWNCGELSLQEKNNLFREHLQQINPADLHYVLRFTCALCPPSCHFILNYLHSTYHSKDRIIPEHVMNCISLCLAEYDGYRGHYIKEAISEVCKASITIHSEDSRLLQQAKVSMLQFASTCGLPVSGLQLPDVIVKAAGDKLTFNSGATLKLLDTLQKIAISRWDQTLREEDYSNIVQFVMNCASIKDVCLFFPSQPPPLHPDTLRKAAAKQVKVTWHIGKFVQTLDLSKGEWQVEETGVKDVRQMQVTDYIDDKVDLMRDLHKEQFIDENGGTLFLPEADISLQVPAGALTKGHVLRIAVPVDTTVTHSGHESYPRTTPLIICEPDNLYFNRPVKLMLPHCAVLKNLGSHSVQVSFGRKAGTQEMTWVTETVEYCLDEHYCSVFINHFSGVDVAIESEEKILRVIPYTKFRGSSKQVMTVWLCNDLESDFQSLMQSEENNEGLPLDSYDTFQLRCVSGLQEKLKVSLDVLEGSSWSTYESEKKFDVQRLSLCSKSNCSFRLFNDGSDDESYMYLLLRVTQAVGEEIIETTFVLRKMIRDLQMQSVKFTKPFSPSKQTNHLFRRETSPQPYTAVIFMDPVKHVNDDVITTLWLLPFDSNTEMFQGFQEELQLQLKHKVGTENSFLVVDTKPTVVTKTHFLNGQWHLSPEEMKIETDRIRFGSRAKFQFIGKREKRNGNEYIELEVETFQEDEEKITFIADVELKKLLYEIRRRKVEESRALEENSSLSSEMRDQRSLKSFEPQTRFPPSTSMKDVRGAGGGGDENNAVGIGQSSKTEVTRTPEEQLRHCFMFLKQNLERGWKDLGRYLNVSEASLDHIHSQWKDDVGECIFQMLLIWQRNKGGGATPAVLLKALTNMSRRDLAEKVSAIE